MWRKISPEKFPPVLGKHGWFPVGETFCVLSVYCVYNTRLESGFIEKYSILLYKTVMEIFPAGSFPNFPKFSRRKFPVGKFPGFPEILLAGNFIDEKFPRFPGIHLGKFSRREFSPQSFITTTLSLDTYMWLATNMIRVVCYTFFNVCNVRATFPV